ncbi:hypothetical protein BURKHO8Y_70092 [Burkholderia sp. 8Y]|nr:hypothetical protein BURKHO8Y_70092 [Burkholderia sp. 8Y]
MDAADVERRFFAAHRKFRYVARDFISRDIARQTGAAMKHGIALSLTVPRKRRKVYRATWRPHGGRRDSCQRVCS